MSNKREFLMLAHDFDAEKHTVFGWYASRKLDGVRAFWDGGISRGLLCQDVPFANIAKHGRFLIPPIATGLWSRYGQPICAPDWWLDLLPKIPLDGELDAGNFQLTSSIVRSSVNAKDWEPMQYACFDIPSYDSVFEDGTINNENMKKTLSGCIDWAISRATKLKIHFMRPMAFYEAWALLNQEFKKELDKPLVDCYWYPLTQFKLPDTGRDQLNNAIQERAQKIWDSGGEGLIIRSPIGIWSTYRSWNMLKLKDVKDAEATVIGYRWGNPTDLERSRTGIATNKLLGLMGTLIVTFGDKTFELGNGFKESERKLVFQDGGDASSLGYKYPGCTVNNATVNPLFPRGAKITFKYRELTNDGIPKEARYFRCV